MSLPCGQPLQNFTLFALWLQRRIISYSFYRQLKSSFSRTPKEFSHNLSNRYNGVRSGGVRRISLIWLDQRREVKRMYRLFTGSQLNTQEVYITRSQFKAQDVHCLFDWITHHHPRSNTHRHKLLEKQLSSVRHTNTGHLQRNTNLNQ